MVPRSQASHCRKDLIVHQLVDVVFVQDVQALPTALLLQTTDPGDPISFR